MAKRKNNPGTLVRFVTRAISDRSKVGYTGRLQAKHSRALAHAAIRAVARGKKRGCK